MPVAQPTLGSELTELRSRTDEPDPLGRWSDANLIPILNRARQQVMTDLQWPESKLFAQTIAGIGEYGGLPEFTKIIRAYLIYSSTYAEPLIYKDISVMEGIQIGLYDRSSSNYSPQWMSQPVTNWPIMAARGYPANQNAPTQMMGNPGTYYLRGGYLGIVPTPGGVYTIQLDCAPAINTLVQPGDLDILPDVALDAVFWYAEYLMAKADKDTENMILCIKAYGGDNGTGGAIGKAISWKTNMVVHKSRAPLFVTSRTRFSGPPRYGSGRGRHGS